MVKNEKRQAAARKAASKNPWVQHVKNCAKEKALSYKQGLQSCRETYKKGSKKDSTSSSSRTLAGAAPIKAKIDKAVLFGDASSNNKVKMPMSMQTELVTKAMRVKSNSNMKRIQERVKSLRK